jgi:putative protein-disulfide isomerase
MTPLLIYCYDAYCGWCYGFSPVMRKIAEEYQNQIFIEVLSGGMIITDRPRPISATAGYIREAYKSVEELTGVHFGEAYLWHITHPEESDWFPSSEKPAIALCVFKESYPDLSVHFASDLQYALHFEGRDLCDDEAYRHLLEKYNIPQEIFYSRLREESYKEKAYHEFDLCRQLQVTGFPTVLMQMSESKFYMLTRGYSDFGMMKKRIDSVLSEVDAL